MDRKEVAAKITKDNTAREAFRKHALTVAKERGIKIATARRAINRFFAWGISSRSQQRSGVRNPVINDAMSRMFEFPPDYQPPKGAFRGLFPQYDMAEKHAQNLRDAGVPRAGVQPTPECWRVIASS